MRHSQCIAALSMVALVAPLASAQELPDIIYELEGARAADIDFSPDGLSLATGGRVQENRWSPGQVRFWSVDDGTLLSQISYQGLGATGDVDFSADGELVASANGTVDCVPDGPCYANAPGQFVWSFPNGGQVATSAPQGIPAGVAFSPDGSLIATAEYYGSQAVKLYDAGFNLLRTLSGHSGGSFAVRFSPAGEVLASCGADGTVKLWQVSNGALLRVLPRPSSLADAESIEFSPDGELLATGYSGYHVAVQVFQVSDGTLLHTIPGSDWGSSSTVAFTPNGRHFAAKTAQYTGELGWHAVIRFWGSADGTLIREYLDNRVNNPNIRPGFAISPDGSVFAYAYADRLILARSPIPPSGPTAPAPGEREPHKPLHPGNLAHGTQGNRGG